LAFAEPHFVSRKVFGKLGYVADVGVTKMLQAA